MNNPSPTIRYGAVRVNGSHRSGYHTHYAMDRPWCAVQNGECLRTESGRLRRFSSASAALAAAALAARSAALNAFAESILRDDELAVTDALADDLARADAAYTKAALAHSSAEVIEVATVNEVGIAEIARFLRENHKLGERDRFGPSELSAWASGAEFQLAEGNSATIEISSADSVTGVPICYRISEAGISRSRHHV